MAENSSSSVKKLRERQRYFEDATTPGIPLSLARGFVLVDENRFSDYQGLFQRAVADYRCAYLVSQN